MLDFLSVQDKKFLIFGVANKKSVAYHITRLLQDLGAQCVLVVQNEKIKHSVENLFPETAVYTCNVEYQSEIDSLREKISARHETYAGLVHSLAYADYSEGIKPFHQTQREAFLQAVNISCFSLMALVNALEPYLESGSSVVTLSISTTRMASENYGYMAPIKAALDSSLAFLAKSCSARQIRFNAVAPGLLKTSASAGIPGYVDSYLYAEHVIPRKSALKTEEAANVAVFLLSPRSSGMNAQKLVVDAGMDINYFDSEVIRRFHRGQ